MNKMILSLAAVTLLSATAFAAQAAETAATADLRLVATQRTPRS